MDESGGTPDGDSTDRASHRPAAESDPVVDIAPGGDVILDVVFDTSRETLRSAKKTIQVQRTHLSTGRDSTRPVLKPLIRIPYRVQLAVLKRHSKYFDNLLSDSRFQEARLINAAFGRLSLANIKPQDADPKDLPRVEIIDDDEATRSAGRDAAFGDLLRILHRVDTVTRPPTMLYVTILAVLADRFDCTKPVSRYLNTTLKFKWPPTQPRLAREDGVCLNRASEEVLRQKILVAWLLDQPTKLHTATRELIMYGSVRWTAFQSESEAVADGATWWDLQDDLERELQHRRECILNTIASILRHFMKLYTSRTRQCKLGYGSSAACDSYQLGEMVKFLTSRRLLYLVDFSPVSLDEVPDLANVDIGHILGILKQCPGYQIDKNHTNCGLRTRILPIIEYIQTMLSSNVVSLSRLAWKKDRASASWAVATESNGADRDSKKVFMFTRSVAGDQRLRMEGAMASDRRARDLFTAQSWDWTPED